MNEREILRDALRELAAATAAYAAKHKVDVCPCEICDRTRAALKRARILLKETPL